MPSGTGHNSCIIATPHRKKWGVVASARVVLDPALIFNYSNRFLKFILSKEFKNKVIPRW